MAVKLIETWYIVLGLLSLGLILFSIFFFFPKNFFKKKIRIFELIKTNFIFLLIIVGVVSIHLIEVNFIDSITLYKIRRLKSPRDLWHAFAW